MKLLVPASLGLAAVLLSGCALMGPSYEPDTDYNLTILHTNDHHGRFWQNSDGEYGMSARKTLIDRIRAEVEAEGGSVMLLSGGDINTGIPESDLQDAEPDFKGMAMLDYDAMAVGNHEFDNPRDVLMQQAQWAGFPFLSANIVYKDNGRTLFEPYEMFNVQGNRIAVVGFTTEDTVKIGNPEYIGDLDFLSPSVVAQEMIPKLDAKSELIIAVTHMGHYANGNSGGNAPGDVTLARSVEGIDVIVGGHSQNPLFEPDVQNGTLILQAYEWGKYVGRLDLTIRNGEVASYEYDLIPVNLKEDGQLMRPELAQNLEMLAMLAPYQQSGSAALDTIIGSANGDFIGDRSVVRNEPTNLGVMVARAQRVKTQADVAVMNSGGIRADMDGGDISYKDVLTVQPFGNMVAYVDFSGAELLNYLNVAASKQAGSGAFAQFDGVNLRINDGEVTRAIVNGREIDPNGTYRLAVNAFMAAGGDGYPVLADHPNYVNTGFVDADVMVEFIQANSPLNIANFNPGLAVVRR